MLAVSFFLCAVKQVVGFGEQPATLAHIEIGCQADTSNRSGDPSVECLASPRQSDLCEGFAAALHPSLHIWRRGSTRADEKLLSTVSHYVVGRTLKILLEPLCDRLECDITNVMAKIVVN